MHHIIWQDYDSEEIEDMIIKPTDSVVICARNEDEVNHLEACVASFFLLSFFYFFFFFWFCGRERGEGAVCAGDISLAIL